ncbi:MAG: 50S ribosomal protein L4 [Bacteroidales bacterium]|nr:50S ribosomal protein L4 [Bacteroidales bacterium]MBS3773869.1 50S ribosomal protein L4 [Bacteroidales bacterium]
MELPVLNKAGEDTGKTIQLNDQIFGIEPNDHAIYLDVKQYMANNRQGTHHAKERNEITASRRKIKRQKGTGTARAGDNKNPIFRGGGRVFGPRPRDYSFKLNKKIKKLARRSALSYKVKDNAIAVVERFDMEQPKTKEFSEIRENLGVSDRKSLFILENPSKNIYLSSRNIPDVKVLPVNELNTYEIMNAHAIVFFEGSLDTLEKHLSA